MAKPKQLLFWYLGQFSCTAKQAEAAKQANVNKDGQVLRLILVAEIKIN